ncbi:MAG: hypothetical protein KJP16_06100 [Gammaproteobacteria bacterium]|nr:hypothetical protein [Gammaproteobacteria bacterium]NNL50374.1 hypothetical protein [Woeseiaceae bacterium]
MVFRLISGAVGLTLLVGTVLLARELSASEPDASVFLAGYFGIGCIMLGVYFLFYAMTGKWRPNLANRNKTR